MSIIRVIYQTIEFGETDVHVRTLRDRQQFADDDGLAAGMGISSAIWPYFGVIWDSGRVLAHIMYEYEAGEQRILEIGCGIALASLVLNQRLMDITATDYNPEAGAFLEKNVELNEGRPIPFICTGWEDDEDSRLGRFDLIIGSDLLYERGHVNILAAFIDQHARQTCEVILVDPGRGHHACFSKKMVSLGYAHSQAKPKTDEYLKEAFKGQVLRYHRDCLEPS
jgi:predicted nicotinamide N-methyase